MYENNIFNIDLTGCFTSSEIITNVSLALELPNAREKKINLKFNDMILSQSQLLSIKSLISSYGSELNTIETSSKEMKRTCDSLEIKCLCFGVPEEDNDYFHSVEKKEEENNAVYETNKENKENIVSENKNTDFYKTQEFSYPLEEEMPVLDNNVSADIDVEKTIFNSALVGIENNKLKEDTQEITQPETELKYNYQEPKQEEQPKDEDMQAYTQAPSEHEGEEYNFYEAPTDEPIVATSEQTIYVTQTLRSGQVLEYNGNIVIIGDCHPGSEIKATGDITVWGVLGCVAHAGIKGDRNAKIRALKMNAVQLRIADVYSRRPDGSNVPYIIRSAEFTPEEARLTEDGIVLYKMN